MTSRLLYLTKTPSRLHCHFTLPVIIVVLATTIWTAAGANTPPDTKLGLRELIVRALTHNPQMSIARAEVEAANARLGQQRAAWYPSVAFEGRIEHSTMNAATPPDQAAAYLDFSSAGLGHIPIYNADTDMSGFSSASAGLSAEYLLVDFGRRTAAVNAADHSLSAARADLDSSGNDTALEVATRYFGLLRSRAIVQIEQDGRDRKIEALRMTRLLHENGRKAAGDIAVAKADLAQAEVDLASANKQAELARLALQHAVGEPPNAPSLVLRSDSRLPDPERFAEDTETALQQALAQRPELNFEHRSIAAADSVLQNRRADILPTVTLFANLTQKHYLNGDITPNYAVGVKFGWTFFDGGQRNHRVDEAQAQLLMSRERLRDQTLNVVNNVRDARQTYIEAKHRLDLTKEVADSRALDLKLARAGYREGIRSVYELSLAESGYRDASAQRIASEYDLQISIARLYWAIGSLKSIFII